MVHQEGLWFLCLQHFNSDQLNSFMEMSNRMPHPVVCRSARYNSIQMSPSVLWRKFQGKTGFPDLSCLEPVCASHLSNAKMFGCSGVRPLQRVQTGMIRRSKTSVHFHPGDYVLPDHLRRENGLVRNCHGNGWSKAKPITTFLNQQSVLQCLKMVEELKVSKTNPVQFQYNFVVGSRPLVKFDQCHLSFLHACKWRTSY